MALDQNNREVGNISWSDLAKGLNSVVKENKNFTNKFEEKLDQLGAKNKNNKEVVQEILKPLLGKMKDQNDLQQEMADLLSKTLLFMKQSTKKKEKQAKDDNVKVVKDNTKIAKDNINVQKTLLKMSSKGGALGNISTFFGNMKKSFSEMWKSQNSTIENGIKKQFELAEEEIDKSYKRMRESMRKKDRKSMVDEAKWLAEQEDRATTKMQKFINTLTHFRSIVDILDKVAPHNLGIGEKYDAGQRLTEVMEEQKNFIRDMQGIVYQSMGSRGSLLRRSPNDLNSAPGYRRAEDDIAQFYSGAYALAENFELTGQRTAKMLGVQANMLRRGIRSYSQFNALSRQAGQLATMIDVDVEHTAEELSDWNQHLGLSIRQTATLSHNMQSISLSTGLTGDRLLSAVRSAKQYAEVMRDAGTLTDQSARNLAQLSAVASQRGTENIISPIRNALLSSTNFFNADTGTQSFLTAAAGQSRNRNAIINTMVNGQMMNTENSGLGLDLAQGMRRLAMQITRGRNVNQLNPQELMIANQVARGFGQTGIQAMFLAADTMRDTFESTADQMNRLNEELRRGNHTRDEQLDLETRIRALNRRQVQERMNEARTNMGRAVSGTMAQADVNRNVDAIVAGLQEGVNNLTGPGMETHKQNLTTRIADINRLRGNGNLSAAEYNTLLDVIDQARGQLGVAERLFQSSESERQINNQIALQTSMESYARQTFEWIQRNAPAEASRWNTIIAYTQFIAQRLIDIATGIQSLLASWTAMGGLGGLLGTVVGGILIGLGRVAPWAIIATGLWKLVDTMQSLYEAQNRLRVATENSNRLANKQSMDKQAYAASIRRGEEDEHYRNEFTQGHFMLRDVDLNAQILGQQQAARDLQGLTEEEIQSGTQRRNNWGGYNLDSGEFARRRNNVLGARDNLEALRTEANRRWQVAQQMGGTDFAAASRNSVLRDLPQILERANGPNSAAAIRALSSAGIDFNALRTSVLAANPNAQGMELSRLMVENLRTSQPNLFNLAAAPSVAPAGPNQSHANGGAPAGQNWNNAWNMTNPAYGYGLLQNGGTLPSFGGGSMPNIPGINSTQLPIPNPFGGFGTGIGGFINVPTTGMPNIPGMPTTPTSSASPANPLNNYANAQQAVDRNMGDINTHTRLTAEETREMRILMKKIVDLMPRSANGNQNNATASNNPNFYTWNSPIS